MLMAIHFWLNLKQYVFDYKGFYNIIASPIWGVWVRLRMLRISAQLSLSPGTFRKRVNPTISPIRGYVTESKAANQFTL